MMKRKEDKGAQGQSPKDVYLRASIDSKVFPAGNPDYNLGHGACIEKTSQGILSRIE